MATDGRPEYNCGDVAYGEGYSAFILQTSKKFITFAAAADGEEPETLLVPRGLFDKLIRRYVGFCD